MTFYEYELRMKACRLKRVDEEYRIYLQAWVNREVKAERKKGKGRTEPVYKRFDRFFDYEKRLEEARGNSVQKRPVSSTAGRYIEFLERRKNGEL
ncbi:MULTISPECIES: hypothetical protein [Clostridia]|uniref:hypothetical protein n=1 Tax=Clostridia TaxID=186801 RepID=UPI0016526036|nr:MULTISPECIES: hypothetical protein [Clostridia]